ncbi:MAG: glycogen/starch/alpha-glucan phosphorylase [Clostridia bacterium]|nr:glycogen/starch/alpha-glucan phosphorylase [Clostridia bacterium]
MDQNFTKQSIREALALKLSRYFGVTIEEANKQQIYRAVMLCVKDALSQKRSDYKEEVKRQSGKTLYYMCMEFLVGRSLRNNLCNLGVDNICREVLAELGISLDEIYELEPDPGLGNGGLGRLAACFMDAATTLNYPATGFSILYEYGLFKQKLVDGQQIELPDNWLPDGDVVLVPRTDKACTVRFGGHVKETWKNGKCDITYENYEEIQAVPYDMMISGADSEAVNVLRLWKAKSTSNFNMNLFSQGAYMQAMEQNTNAEIISKVLYPSDNHTEGKLLRLSQQYFLVSASLQCIIADHLRRYGSLWNFADKVAIHINDTHPALVIPELMRLLIDVHSYSWEQAWDVVTRTVTYTNHTVMPEALETWNEDLFAFKLPRIHTIVCEINRRLCADLWNCYPGDWDRISRMAIIGYGAVRMANLSVAASHTVNGVSKLHSDILTKTVFHDFYKYTPEKFTNVTNGIAHRRWLCYANPALTGLLDNLIGTSYHKQPETLSKLLEYKDDKDVLEQILQIKRENKVRFSNYVAQRTGTALDPDSIFDVQVKRLHEYKRQMLNALRIISLYNALRENPNLDIQPQTFIFGAKAAPGYDMAKRTIKMICDLSREIERDPRIREKLRIVFMEEYNVSMAEVLIPSADISEQISLAGKEASGTGCMKLMINGAVTIGTLDGANVEIHDAVGDDNMYLFGLTTPEVEDLWLHGYNAATYYVADDKLKKTVDTFALGFNGNSYRDFVDYLVIGRGIADPYMCLADFESYCNVHERMIEDYKDRMAWAKMSLVNTASAGIFAADRAITEYAKNIWHMSPITAPKATLASRTANTKKK